MLAWLLFVCIGLALILCMVFTVRDTNNNSNNLDGDQNNLRLKNVDEHSSSSFASTTPTVITYDAPLTTHEKYVIVTSANDKYYKALLTLLSSIYKCDSTHMVNRIVVYDLGLQASQIAYLQLLKNVLVLKFPSHMLAFQEMLTPKQHAYKWPMVYDAAQHSDFILWMDAGAMFLQDVKRVFDIIEAEDVFLVQDGAHTNRVWTSKECIQIMKATEEELSAPQLCSGMTGFKVHGQYHDMLLDCVRYSNVKNCVFGPQTYSNTYFQQTGIKGHRHDQAISSILAARYQCPLQPIGLYGEFDMNVAFHSPDVVIYVHRCAYFNDQHLEKKKVT